MGDRSGIILGIGGHCHTPFKFCLLFLFLESKAANDCALGDWGSSESLFLSYVTHTGPLIPMSQNRQNWVGIGGSFFQWGQVEIGEKTRRTLHFRHQAAFLCASPELAFTKFLTVRNWPSASEMQEVHRFIIFLPIDMLFSAWSHVKSFS